MLDQFTHAYVACALWSSMDQSDETGGEPLDKNYGIEDIDPQSLERMAAECSQFQTEQAPLLEQAGSEAQNGRDFWLTRNGHGTGFCDSEYPSDVGEQLTARCRVAGERDLYVGDDGKVYLS